MKPALLVIDMVRDFVTGRLGFEAARALVAPMREFLAWARFHRLPVAYLQDAHVEGDPEIPLWGEHAMAGTEGAETVPELAPRPGELVLHKHVYSGFQGTDLAERLRERVVDTVLLVGVATDICVQHTCADAFFRRFRPVVLSDLTATLDPERHRRSLEYMRAIHGAEIVTAEEARRRFAPLAAAPAATGS
jgi:nicotinamidase-related amidase